MEEVGTGVSTLLTTVEGLDIGEGIASAVPTSLVGGDEAAAGLGVETPRAAVAAAAGTATAPSFEDGDVAAAEVAEADCKLGVAALAKGFWIGEASSGASTDVE